MAYFVYPHRIASCNVLAWIIILHYSMKLCATNLAFFEGSQSVP
jgi:hypothetical protein